MHEREGAGAEPAEPMPKSPPQAAQKEVIRRGGIFSAPKSHFEPRQWRSACLLDWPNQRCQDGAQRRARRRQSIANTTSKDGSKIKSRCSIQCRGRDRISGQDHCTEALATRRPG